MAEYVVKMGQNLIDVALTLYGSIEGLLDLMVNNPGLSLDTEIRNGDKLNYTPYYYEDTTVLQYYKSNDIVPSNRVGDIYMKKMDNLKVEIYESAVTGECGFIASGEGDIYVDWGDNSDIEKITLSSTPLNFTHQSLGQTSSIRKIRFYGNFKLYTINVSGLIPSRIFFFSTVSIETMGISGAMDLMDINFMTMVLPENVVEIEFVKTRIKDATPLIPFKNAHTINLGYCNMTTSVLDKFLIGLVENYGIRRNCTVNLTGSALPPGEYKKPENMLHPKTGMEAIWVLVNEHKEPSGPWKIILNNKTYTI
mgnify:FL=1